MKNGFKNIFQGSLGFERGKLRLRRTLEEQIGGLNYYCNKLLLLQKNIIIARNYYYCKKLLLLQEVIIIATNYYYCKKVLLLASGKLCVSPRIERARVICESPRKNLGKERVLDAHQKFQNFQKISKK